MRACIPRDACARESYAVADVERMELSKISNPTNLVGELPGGGGGGGGNDARTPFGADFFASRRGIYFFFTRDGYVFAIETPAVCIERYKHIYIYRVILE